MLTQATLKELLNYDPITGIFTWVKPINNRYKIGDIAGSKDAKGYIVIGVNKKQHKAHRLAWLYMMGEWPTKFIDHINGVRDCNIFDNLRGCTNQQNLYNVGVRRNNTSGHKGVCWHKKSSKWVAQAMLSGKHYHLGLFATPEQANEVRQAFIKHHHGEFYREIS